MINGGEHIHVSLAFHNMDMYKVALSILAFDNINSCAEKDLIKNSD